MKSVSMPLNLQLNDRNADVQGVNCVFTWNSVLRNNSPGLGHEKRKPCFTGATDPFFPIWDFFFFFFISIFGKFAKIMWNQPNLKKKKKKKNGWKFLKISENIFPKFVFKKTSEFLEIFVFLVESFLPPEKKKY